MYGSIFWVEWLDRLDRVLTGTRQDVVALNRAASPRRLAALERAKRQLTALSNDLRLLDRTVLGVGGEEPSPDIADNLQKALDTAVVRIEDLTGAQAASPSGVREEALAAIDSALRDSRYEAALLLEPGRRRA